MLKQLVTSRVPIIEVTNNDPVYIVELIESILGTKVKIINGNKIPDEPNSVFISDVATVSTSMYKDLERINSTLIFLSKKPLENNYSYFLGEIYPTFEFLEKKFKINKATYYQLAGRTTTQINTTLRFSRANNLDVRHALNHLYPPNEGVFILEKDNKPYSLQGKLLDWMNLNYDILKNDVPVLRPRGIMLTGKAGTGKEQPLDTLTPTPRGFVKFGDLKVGDEIFGRDGKPTKVIGIYPQGIKPSYKVTFRDGTQVNCGLNHLWNVIDPKTKKEKTLSLKDMVAKGIRKANGDMKFKVPLCSPVEYEKTITYLDPYIVGCLIGDGSLINNAVYLSCATFDDFILNKVESLLPPFISLSIRSTGENCTQSRFVDNRKHSQNEVKDFINSLKLNVKSADKFIPDCYKYSSIDDRISLLRGLMDTDGCARGNRISFSTKSLQLAKDIQELVLSLGGVAIIHTYDRSKDNKGIEYSVNVKTFQNPFSLPRKADEWKLSEKNPPSKYIAKVEYVGCVEQQCIKVDADDELYLTDNYIVTHNTSFAKYLGEQLDWTVVKLDISNSLKRYIGESEAQVKNHLQSIAQMTPCVLLIDEVEKLFNGKDETGVINRILGYFLWWLAEHKEQIFTIMTSNDLSSVPKELYREGRLDEVIVLQPLSNIQAYNFALDWLSNNQLSLPKKLNDELKGLCNASEEVTPTQAIEYARKMAKKNRQSSKRHSS